jgi:hypothetical protein
MTAEKVKKVKTVPEEVTQAIGDAKKLAYEDSNALLKAENAVLKEKMAGMVEMTLAYQSYIPSPPVSSPDVLYDRACSNDAATISSWKAQWLAQVETNNSRFKFEDNSMMQEFGKNAYKPCIVAGSGPSLKKNAHLLADRGTRGDISIVSCLHNFGYFVDMGIDADYYVNLDAGNITIPEMSQGGKHSEEFYWERTEGKTLLTVIHGNPELIQRWRGKILFYNVVAADQDYIESIRKITKFGDCFNVGGNTLGACMYMAKAILGSSIIGYVGADFSFSYTRKFHPFDSPYDNQFSGVVPWTDIYGNRVWTWRSYLNFKYWFDYIACGGKNGLEGIFFNCTEGGILGSYTEGNILQIRQSTLSSFLNTFNAYRKLPQIQAERPEQYCLLF